MGECAQDQLAALLARPIAHRGLHACGGSGPVENSISAARAAIAAGYGIECDVQLSRDGEAIVFHDEELDRLTESSGRLADVDAAALGLLHLRAGSDHPPTLPALLATICGRVPLVIEIKALEDGDTRLADRTLDMIQFYRGPLALESFDPTIVLHCRKRQAACPIGLVGPADSGRDPDPTVLAACDFLSWSIDGLARVARQHPTLPRTTWTVRTRQQADLADRYDAQIVFEGPEVLAAINDRIKKATP